MNATHKAMKTKVCPSCHSTLFADMDVCYGCLYDFNRVSQAPVLVCPEQLDAPHEGAPYEADSQPPLEAYMRGATENSCDNVQQSEQGSCQQDSTAEQIPCCSQAHNNCKLIEVEDAQVIVIVRGNS